ncbi:MAG: BON domain-containing protein [Paracoccaceae bacterium]
MADSRQGRPSRYPRDYPERAKRGWRGGDDYEREDYRSFDEMEREREQRRDNYDHFYGESERGRRYPPFGANPAAGVYPGYGTLESARLHDTPHRRRREWADRDHDNERGFWDRASDEVASWFGDEDAERRREADHRGKGPQGYKRSDARIVEDVSDRLSDHPLVDATGIEVAVKDGEVTLSGTVDSKHAKRRAEDCADDVSGVTHVQNNLRVQMGDPGNIPGSARSQL